MHYPTVATLTLPAQTTVQVADKPTVCRSFSFFTTISSKMMTGAAPLRACLLIAPLVLSLAGGAEAKSIGKDQVNIRSGPSLKSSIVFTAPLGYPIKIEKEADNWSFFHDWQNNTGWVYKPLVSDIDTAVVLVEKANVRSDATIESKIVSTVEQGEIYTILAKKNNWIKLGYYHGNSELGWIRDDLVFGE